MTPRSVLPAVREPGDDLDAPAIQDEFKSPYGRSDIAGPVTAEEAAAMKGR